MLCAVFVMLVNYLNPLRMLDKLPVNVRKMMVSAGKITMEQPRLSRFIRDAGVDEFTAAAAAQDMTKPNIIKLKGIRAKVQMQDNSMMTCRQRMVFITARLTR